MVVGKTENVAWETKVGGKKRQIIDWDSIQVCVQRMVQVATRRNEPGGGGSSGTDTVGGPSMCVVYIGITSQNSGTVCVQGRTGRECTAGVEWSV